MEVEWTGADLVPAKQELTGVVIAMEERAKQQHRDAIETREGDGNLPTADAGSVDEQRRVSHPFDQSTQRPNDVDRDVDVADLGDVVEDDLLVGQQARDDLLGRRVLGAARADLAA